MPKTVFETMNGLRGVAALVVVMYHRPEWFGALSPAKGFLAVDIFFVLSGFVIAFSYEKKFANGMGVKSFILVRVLRLYPLYSLGTILGIIALTFSFLSNGHITGNSVLGWYSIPFASLMLPTPNITDISAPLYPLNIPAWSLLFELIINVIYAVTWTWWKPNILLATMITVGLAIMMSPRFGDAGWNWSSINFGFLRVLYSFPAGVLIYQLYKSDALRLPRVNSLFILAAFLIMLILPFGWMTQFLVLIGFPLLVLGATKSEPAAVFRPLFSALGAASYAIYSIHAPLMIITKAVLGKLGADSYPHLTGVLFLAVVCPSAFLIDKWCDAPLRQVLRVVLLRSPKPNSLARPSI